MMIHLGLMLHLPSFDHETYANIFQSHSVALNNGEVWLGNKHRAKDTELLLVVNL